MKRLMVVISIFILLFAYCRAEIENDPIKRLYLQMELAEINNTLNSYYLPSESNALAELGKQKIDIIKTLYGEESIEYANSLNDIASRFSTIGEQQQAMELYIKAISVLEIVLGDTHIEYACTLNNLAICYEMQGCYSMAIELAEKVLKIRLENLGERHSDYLQSLNYLAILYSNIGNHHKANMLEEEAKMLNTTIATNTEIERDPNKRLNLQFDLYEINSKIESYYDKCYYGYCIKLGQERLKIVKSLYGLVSEEYSNYLGLQAFFYSKIGNIVKAIEFEEKALDIREEIFGDTHKEIAKSLNNLAEFYYQLGCFPDAIQLSKKALLIIEEELGDTHIYNVLVQRNLANCYLEIGNLSSAIALFEKALKVTKETLGENHFHYKRILNDLANAYGKLGDYSKARELVTKASYGVAIDWDESNDISMTEDSMIEAQYYAAKGNYFKAIQIIKEVLEIIEINLGKKNSKYIETLYLLANYYSEINNYSKAIILGEEVLILSQQLLSKNHPFYAQTLDFLSYCYINIGNYLKALDLGKEALNLRLIVLGEKHIDCATSLGRLVRVYKEIKDLYNLDLYTKRFISASIDIMSNYFYNMTSKQRRFFWNTQHYLYYESIPKLAYTYKTDTLIGCAYDGTLMSKGILLNTEIELATLIAESGDKVADELYQQLLLNRGQLNKLYEMPISERWADTDSMELATEKIEHELIERSKVYGDFTRNLTIDWKQVQAQLKENDIAIEFLSFPIENDSVMYCALTLKHDYEAPRMVPLFEARDLAKIAETDYFTTSKLTQLVWQPLAEELQSVRNIYFAPTGELHRIAIEYLPYGDEGQYIFDYWNLYRLSSTRELAKTKSDKNSTNIALYGGLRYEAEGVKFEKDVTWGTNYLAMTRALPDSIGLRAQYGYLHGTLNEVTEINALYEKNSIPTILYTGSIGTESTIKALSGKRISNLHISTHGFYYSEKEVESKHDLRHLSFLQHDDTPRYIEDKSMTRSGLLFAGANAILQGDSIPEGCDDGILTAQEIASLDFRGLDLLVLSACQTGLGEIKGDGVFGLQRGFKKAGAQTIVMSLWKVDDFATNLLMTQFYNNLLAGHSKREAFHKAQEIVRSNYPDDPHKWAGFIMLDGID